jgi:DNA invertase Pin-like site-specific DNA recombinase
MAAMIVFQQFPVKDWEMLLHFTGEDSPMANRLLSVKGAFAEFERALIRERQREGIALACEFGISRETLYQYIRSND